MIIQVYEIQTPAEAAAMAALGVDHIGTVLLRAGNRADPIIADTVRAVQACGRKSSLIPLFSGYEDICRILDGYRPDILHFCEVLSPYGKREAFRVQALAQLQGRLREAYPGVGMMRSLSVPVAREGTSSTEVAEGIRLLAEPFFPITDYFMMDTFRGMGQAEEAQPVDGFVGITGDPCDWDISARVAFWSPVPIILAGGLSGENVAAAIDRVRPDGVDSCTRTNAVDADGRPIRFRKDPERVRQFVEAARRAALDLQG